MTVVLQRFAYLPKGTLGEIKIRDEHVCYILERPWLHNERSVSCIPEGRYDVRPDEEGRYTGYPEICDVVGRTEIIIHPANRVHELHGCLAPGTGYAFDGVEPFVTESRKAYGRLLMMAGKNFTLEIRARQGI